MPTKSLHVYISQIISFLLYLKSCSGLTECTESKSCKSAEYENITNLDK